MIKYQKKLTEDNDGIWFQIRPRRIFYFNIPESLAVPKHTLLDDKELKVTTEELSMDRVKMSEIPLIKEHDPPVVWLGGRANRNDIIKVDRFSKQAIHTVAYRKVVM